MSFMAKYEGQCDDCREAIAIGDVIEQKPNGRYVHEVCPEAPPDYDFELKPGEVVCDVCFLVKPCSCEVS
jgi:hypothetical protein